MVPSALLNDAIAAELAGVLDHDGRSPLDVLIANLHGPKFNEAQWQAAVVEAVHNPSSKSGWWGGLERFVVSLGLATLELGRNIEIFLAKSSSLDGSDRASIYSLLDQSGLSVTATMLESDRDLRRSAPVTWLDLIIPRLFDLDHRQSLILESVRSGALTLDLMAPRLELLRLAGGKQFGEWLRQVRAELPTRDHREFDRLANEGFGLRELPELASVPS